MAQRLWNPCALAVCNVFSHKIRVVHRYPYCAKGKVTTLDKKVLNISNIIGSFNPNATKRILLCAHWDTRPFADQDIKNTVSPIDGANDGGSGVAVLLELARQLSMKKTELGIDIIFFDAEDWGDTSNTQSS